MMKQNVTDKLPIGRALLWIALSVVVVGGLAVAGWNYHRYLQNRRAVDEKYHITAIVQTGPVKEALSTVYLAELLNLSADRPVNLFQYDIKKAEQQLLTYPVIKTARIKKILPNILYVDYAIRQPIAMLYDLSNTAIDTEGYIFPLQPFFTPKRLPELYLGQALLKGADKNINHWNNPVRGPEMDLATTLFSILSEPQFFNTFRLLRIDVANAFAESYGRREIVVIIEDRYVTDKEGFLEAYQFPRILRLSPKRFKDELACYLLLRDRLSEYTLKKNPPSQTKKMPGVIVDLRIPRLAFLKE